MQKEKNHLAECHSFTKYVWIQGNKPLFCDFAIWVYNSTHKEDSIFELCSPIK